MTDPAEFDLVVVGSGAAGMTAALAAARNGLSAVVLEKAPTYGGSTARSGGGVWVPNNQVILRSGVPDTPEAASAYLNHIVGDVVPAELKKTVLDHGPEMLDFVLANTPLKFAWVKGYSDYYPEAPGGMPGGRSIEPKPMPASLIGSHLETLTRPYLASPMDVAVTQADYRWLNLVRRHPRGMLRALRVGARGFLARVRKRRQLAMGQALAGGIRAGLAKAGVPVWLETALMDLETQGDRVTGVRVTKDGKESVVFARYGVLLASGGFERSEELRKKYQREPIGTQWTVGAHENTGDGIEAGLRLGAAVDLMDDAWWGPSIVLSGGPYFCLAERTLPGCIMVNAEGKRFVNEAAPYVDAVHAMYGEGDGPAKNFPTWLIADQRYRNRYVFAGLYPGQPFPGRWYKAGAVVKASTLQELAEQIDVSPEGLAETVKQFNGFAKSGKDEEFRRGESAYDKYYGDPRNRPNPCLAPLEVAPFYAVRIVPGDLGTKGGLRTDSAARVLREDGSIIEGLYAAGNASAAVMGRTYAGPGATIGPAMTFGYLAALNMAALAKGSKQ
ncbi:3-oxosteroid 1-dehydrogenase [Kibdelosporangium philippinense]|uniref:3-oxosteroid 1-dehydrogenase n=1 Tax=Kibdelosporangium philippinense TaxID=211113 RepID=A0ABS8Z624_9PSEU|nr:3-oxosteroid 1-dehydrogenase [Kibdelosporangium philippinense]MCE7001317.1 3-oxosteroid 1-dehydrogenase [Kibdelosporangium philippinense]